MDERTHIHTAYLYKESRYVYFEPKNKGIWQIFFPYDFISFFQYNSLPSVYNILTTFCKQKRTHSESMIKSCAGW